MLAYRHGFHAGNHADVLKHLVLIAILDALLRKPKPFFVLDSHAGDGGYRLDTAVALKLREYEDGIGRLWGVHGLHPLIDAYLEAVEIHNPDGKLEQYPGSPLLTAERLRPGDRLLAAEAHATASSVLIQTLKKYPLAQVHKGDGYALLKSALPPGQRRGLVLMDPSFEVPGEFDRLIDAVRLIHHRFRQGIIAIWYPLLAHKPVKPWLEKLCQAGISDILMAELHLMEPDQTLGLYGSGMLIVNPPWGLEDGLRQALPLVSKQLTGDSEGARVVTLIDERGVIASPP